MSTSEYVTDGGGVGVTASQLPSSIVRPSSAASLPKRPPTARTSSSVLRKNKPPIAHNTRPTKPPSLLKSRTQPNTTRVKTKRLAQKNTLSFAEWHTLLNGIIIGNALNTEDRDKWNLKVIIEKILQELKNRQITKIEIAYKQILKDRDFLAAMYVKGSLSFHEVEKQKGGQYTNIKNPAEAVVKFLNYLKTTDATMRDIVINIEKFVTSHDLFASFITYEKDTSVHIIRYVINAFAACDNALLSSLTSGVAHLINHYVTFDDLQFRLRDITNNMTETLLCNIIKKDHHRRRVYNACYLYFVNSNSINAYTTSETSKMAYMFGKVPKFSNVISEECTEIIKEFVLNKAVPNPKVKMYPNVFPMFDLSLDDIVQGTMLTEIYCRLNVDAANALATEIINIVAEMGNNPKLVFKSLDAYERIYTEAYERIYTDASFRTQYETTNATNMCTIFNYLQTVPKPFLDDPTYGGDLYTLCYVAAHGKVIDKTKETTPIRKITNDDVIKKLLHNEIVPTHESQQTARVPDNVLMIRIGNFGHLTGVYVKSRDTNVCYENNILDWIDKLGGTGSEGFDIVPPGYPCHNLKLTSDPDTIKEEDKITGKVFCESDQQLSEIPKEGMFLKQLLEEVSDLGTSIGKPVLLIISHCMRTEDKSFISHSIRATETALQQLPDQIFITNLDNNTSLTSLKEAREQSIAKRKGTKYDTELQSILTRLKLMKTKIIRPDKLERIPEEEDPSIPPNSAGPIPTGFVSPGDNSGWVAVPSASAYYSDYDSDASDADDSEQKNISPSNFVPVKNDYDSDSDASEYDSDADQQNSSGGGRLSSTYVSIAILGAVTVVAAFFQR